MLKMVPRPMCFYPFVHFFFLPSLDFSFSAIVHSEFYMDVEKRTREQRQSFQLDCSTLNLKEAYNDKA